MGEETGFVRADATSSPHSPVMAPRCGLRRRGAQGQVRTLFVGSCLSLTVQAPTSDLGAGLDARGQIGRTATTPPGCRLAPDAVESALRRRRPAG
jgi:hypothetical protein